MKAAVIVSPGLETIAQQELQERLKIKAKIESSLLLFEINKKNLALSTRLQSIRRIILPCGEIINDNYVNSKNDGNPIVGDINITFDPKFNFKEYFPPEIKDIKLKIEVENLKGQENRMTVSKKITEKLFPLLEASHIQAKIDYKKPDFLFIVYNLFDNASKNNQSDSGPHRMIMGLDYTGKELNLRPYRLFPHAASFKGDLAYYLVRKSGFKKKEKLLVGFCKDGALAIEAALFSPEAEIQAFDSSISNVTAAKKNAKLAKVEVEINKHQLEDLDVKYSASHFHRAIFHITQKDEMHLNEIYYQAHYVLKAKCTLLFIGRKNWEITIPKKFKLLSEEEFFWGESVYKLFLLEKK